MVHTKLISINNAILGKLLILYTIAPEKYLGALLTQENEEDRRMAYTTSAGC